MTASIALPGDPLLPRQASTDAAWVGTAGPQAIRVGTAVVYTWAGSNGIWVGSIHDNGAQRQRRLIATGMDDHNVAAVGVRPDGRILVAYSRHNDTAMRVKISANPGDVRTWGSEVVAARGSITYPALTYLSAEHRWFLFFRNGGSSDGPLEVTTSTDGITWTRQMRLTTDTNRSHYTVMGSDGVDRIELLISDGHPRFGGTPLYHLRRQDGRWRNSTVELGPPPFTFGQLTKVYGGTLPASVWDIRPDGDGAAAVFTTFPTWADHRYQYAHLDGGTWTVREITAAGGSVDPSGTQPSYSGGITIDTADPSLVTLSRQNGSNTWIVQQQTTADGGQSWSAPRVLATTGKNLRPESVWNDPGGMMWFTGRYDRFTDFDTTAYYAR